jgi:adenylylsulfate kinase-like enzyme
MTGVGQAYETPENHETHLDGRDAIEHSAAQLMAFIQRRSQAV